MYYVYIIKCEGDLLYTGITTDVDRRMDEHERRTPKGAKFTRSHKFLSLEALWSCGDRSLASKLEYRIKQLTKAQKLRLIADNSCFSELIRSENAELYCREII
ncbi:GIY-YIG nuclease family protein [Ruminococcus flavefaciens]|jgi:putative endonuclease|uniref:Putative endonuclease n=1 Tax=Ruminococcus flavefaciens TaxID=1265 RepID=A0A1K1PLT3_RUMFL|nr:GIY-YIG nuclease family protein [Ruminococcus flavefaciens]SFW47670.1 putative endonuclease [Ruminococcus flavefaciens]